MVAAVAGENCRESGHEHDRRHDHSGPHLGERLTDRLGLVEPLIELEAVAGEEVDRVVDGDPQADRQGTHRNDVERLPRRHHPAGGGGQREHVGDDCDQPQPQRPEGHHHDDENLDRGGPEAAGQVDDNLIEIAPAHDRLAGKRELEAGMRSLDPLQGLVDPFERRLAGDRAPVGNAEGHPRRPLHRIVEALLERRRQEIEEIHPIARRPLPGKGIDEPADGERVAEERFGGDHAIDLAENIGDLLRSLAVGPLKIGRADVEPPHRLVEVVEGALRGAPGGENVRLPIIRLEPQRHESEHHKQPDRQGAGDPGVAEGEVDAAGDVVELAADHFPAGAAGENAAPGGNAAQRQHRQHRHPRAGDTDHARPAEVADHLMARQRQRRHSDRGRDHRQETGHADRP